MYCVQEETFNIFGGYVSDKFHDRKATMLNVFKTSWEKWGCGNQTYNVIQNTKRKNHLCWCFMEWWWCSWLNIMVTKWNAVHGGGETENLFLQNEVFVVPPTFFSMSLHTSIYSAVTTTISDLSCEGYRFAEVSSPSPRLSQTHCGCLTPATLLAGSVGSCLSSYPQTLHSDCVTTLPASSSPPHWLPAIPVLFLPVFSNGLRNPSWRLNTGHFGFD